MPLTDANILSALPAMALGGLDPPPYDLLDVAWENGLAARRIPYVDGAVHDDVGRGPFSLSARLYFVNTLSAVAANGERYFPEYWKRWQEMLLSGVARDFQHPVLGAVRARVKGGKYVVRESCRSGIVVDITLEETVEDPADLNVNGYTNTTLPSQALAAAADDAMAQWIADDPTLAFGFGRPPASLALQYGIGLSTNALAALTAVLRTGATIGAVFGAITGLLFSSTSASAQILTALQGDVDVMIQALRGKRSVFSYAATDKMIAFYLACENMKRGMVASARPTKIMVTAAPSTLDGIARSTGNSLKDIMGLNLALLRAPTVPRGVAVVYYAQL